MVIFCEDIFVMFFVWILVDLWYLRLGFREVMLVVVLEIKWVGIRNLLILIWVDSRW